MVIDSVVVSWLHFAVVAGASPAPNTYRGARPIIVDGPTKRALRDLETHRCPHAGPFKVRAERRSVLQLASSSVEGQDTVFPLSMTLYCEWSGTAIQSKRRATPVLAQHPGCGLGHRHIGAVWVRYGLIGTGSS